MLLYVTEVHACDKFGPPGRSERCCCACQGVATGEVALVIESPPERGEKQKRRSTVKLGIKLEIIPTPPRSDPLMPSFVHCLVRASSLLAISITPVSCQAF